MQAVVNSAEGCLPGQGAAALSSQPCPHGCAQQGSGPGVGGGLFKGLQQVALDSPRLWILLCTTPRKQKSLSGKHKGELSRKKVLEMSRSSAPARCALGAGAGCSQFPPFPSPSCVSRECWPGMPGSHLDRGVGVGESPGMQPKGLCGTQVPSLHPEREQMFGIQLLPDLRRCTEDMESPSGP